MCLCSLPHLSHVSSEGELSWEDPQAQLTQSLYDNNWQHNLWGGQTEQRDEVYVPMWSVPPLQC